MRNDVKIGDLVKLLAKSCSKNSGFKFADVARPDLPETQGINLKVKDLLAFVLRKGLLRKKDVGGYTILYNKFDDKFALYFGLFQKGDHRLFNMHKIKESENLKEIIDFIDKVIKGRATLEEVEQLVPF